MSVRQAARLFVAGAIGTLVVNGFVPASASSVSDAVARQRAELSASRHRLDQKRRQLTFEEERERDLRRQLAETASAIGLVRDRLDTVDRQIGEATAAQERARGQLAEAQDALAQQRHASALRLVRMYEYPPVRMLSVLVGSASFADLTERWHDLALIAHEDQREVSERRAAVLRVDRARAALQAVAQRLESARAAQSQEQSQLNALGAQRAGLVTLAETHRVAVAREVRYLEDLTAQEEAQLEALIRAEQAALARERRAGRIPTPSTPTLGEMQWPLRGPITSPFGMRLNPFGGGQTEFHPGIDIAVDVGTPVASAADGRVIVAGWVSGYGNYVAVDHGNGLSTGYGHLSQIYVAVGQNVQRGQALGASGNTGRSTGPHLIFEVRRNGTPVDPTPYLQ